MDQTIAHDDPVFRPGGDIGFVGYHNDGFSALMHFAEKLHDFNTGRRIQISGWLVCEDDHGICHECTSDCGTLLLSAGELGWAMEEPLFQTDDFGEMGCAFPAERFTDSLIEQGKCNVFLHRQLRNEIERLEDEADVGQTDIGEAIVIELGDILTV